MVDVQAGRTLAMIWFLLFALVLSVVWAGAATYAAHRFGMMVWRMEDSLDESLETLDDAYKSIAAMARQPLLYDSLEVRAMLTQVTRAKNSIISAAQKIAGSAGMNELIENTEETDIP